MWAILFFIASFVAFIFVVFIICLVYLIQVQTKKVDELETENWGLWQEVEQYQMYFERRRMDDLGEEVNGWLEHLEETSDWYDDAWEDVRRILENDDNNNG